MRSGCAASYCGVSQIAEHRPKNEVGHGECNLEAPPFPLLVYMQSSDFSTRIFKKLEKVRRDWGLENITYLQTSPLPRSTGMNASCALPKNKGIIPHSHSSADDANPKRHLARSLNENARITNKRWYLMKRTKSKTQSSHHSLVSLLFPSPKFNHPKFSLIPGKGRCAGRGC